MIKSKKAGLRFRRLIEVDDPSHEWRDETRRTTYFESQGFAVIRFTNQVIAKEPGSVLGTIEAWIEDNTPLAGSAGTPPNVAR